MQQQIDTRLLHPKEDKLVFFGTIRQKERDSDALMRFNRRAKSDIQLRIKMIIGNNYIDILYDFVNINVNA